MSAAKGNLLVLHLLSFQIIEHSSKMQTIKYSLISMCVYIYPVSHEGGHHLYGVSGPLHGCLFKHIGLFKLGCL
jgi:hypothetical protein